MVANKPHLSADQSSSTVKARLITDAVKCLTSSITCIGSESLTMKQKFCWCLVASCCSCVCATTENLDTWLHNDFIGHLVQVFGAYCKENIMSPDECIIIEGIPIEVSSQSSQDIIR